MAEFYINDINPLHFVDASPNPAQKYRSRHMNRFPFPDTIHYWQQPVDWAQPWQTSTDSIRLHLLSEVGPVRWRLFDASGYEHDSGLLQQKQQHLRRPTLYIYELDLELISFADGYYYMDLEFGSPVTNHLRSNLLVFGNEIDDTLLVEYSHNKYFRDVYFPVTGYKPMLRTYGTLTYKKPGSRNAIYENQELDFTLLSGKPYSLWQFYAGGPEGIPDFMVPKFNAIFCLSNVGLDGILYTKSGESAAWDEKEEENYPMRGWSIELRDKRNRASRVWTDDPLVGGGIGGGGVSDTDGNGTPDVPVPGPLSEGVVAVAVVEQRGFVQDNATGAGVFQTIFDVD